MKAIELFAGAGGLAIGVSRAGFNPALIIERDQWCCDTLRENRALIASGCGAWPSPMKTDIRDVDFRNHEGAIALVAGGPPCQPFSMGGKHGAYSDRRDMWSEAVRVVREVRPQAFIFENVRGLTRQSFATYFSYIMIQLQHPSIAKTIDEEWADHYQRLQKHHTSASATEYKVVFSIVDTADFGVPQRRHRVVLVGFRADVDANWAFPRATHSLDALLQSQQRRGEYWNRLQVPVRERAYAVSQPKPGGMHLLPWVTVRDALDGLPDARSEAAKDWFNHRYQPGARSYAGHTGSFIDLPGKALKAGVHGVPGGENMVRLHDGSVRYFTVREAARLQAFPDHWRFQGSWSEAMRQLGNAVPTTLGEVIATSVGQHLSAVGG